MSRKFLGFVFLLLGLVWLLANLDIIFIRNFFGIFLSSLMFTIGVYGIWLKRELNAIYVLLAWFGTLFILANLDVISYHLAFQFLWPSILIVIGCSFIFQVVQTPKEKKGRPTNNFLAIFGGVQESITDTVHENMEATAVFGGVELDYRNAQFKEGKTYLEATVAFGGITVIVPEDVKVTATAAPIFGGVENKTKDADSKKELVITGIIVFGGIEVKK